MSQPYYYEGEFKLLGFNILRHGKGKMFYFDGASYDGFWKNDVYHDENTAETAEENGGFSKFTAGGNLIHFNHIESPSYFYTGNYHLGRKSGQGCEINLEVMTQNNVNKNMVKVTYSGSFLNNVYNGFGFLLRENLDLKQVVKQSPPVPVSRSISQSHSHPSKVDKLLTLGKNKFNSARHREAPKIPTPVAPSTPPQYETKAFLSITEYHGQFKHGQYSGFGRLTSSDGSICEGPWLANKLHGSNIKFYKPNMGTFVGEFSHGNRGQGIVKPLLYK